MTNYKLYQYSNGEDETLIEQSDSLTYMFKLAIAESKENYRYTYRLESYVDYKPIGGFRYFEKGKDVTEEFREMILHSLGN